MSFVEDLLYWLRDIRAKRLFEVLQHFASGKILDVGGLDFYSRVKDHVSFEQWTCLEITNGKNRLLADDKFSFVIGDGTLIPFAPNTFDTVINVQVLEHVFEPMKMLGEMVRVLKPGGHLILLLPQTSTIHLAPHHYYNFTRFWVDEVYAFSKEMGLQRFCSDRLKEQ